jgi:hypothetical protein
MTAITLERGRHEAEKTHTKAAATQATWRVTDGQYGGMIHSTADET